jgi:lipopolysaccharide transport system ATP-binding protein
MSVVIQVDRLSKHYRLGTIGGKRLVDDVNRWWAKVRGREDPLSKVGSQRPVINGSSSRGVHDELLWALRNVSFEVKQGEVLGIIGRNGAGKSTLLKILSRVTAPTSGEVRVKGRIASLLEVGTGFHPELTGRENIYLNGAILGMTKTEIRIKFDEIVAFSGMEKFIDTPVKRYSSGMTVRLAFAVAAHLEPEILIIDEVLAVGDAEFQKKCLGKMQDVAGQGRTVLFVSHNMDAVKALCNRAILLKAGTIAVDGQTKQTISHYLTEYAFGQYSASPAKIGAPHIARCWFSDKSGTPQETFRSGDPITVNVEMINPERQPLMLEFAFFDNGRYKLWNFTQERYNIKPITAGPRATVRVTFFVPALHPHEVFLHVGLCQTGEHARRYLDHITENLRCFVEPATSGNYQATDALIDCPIEFQMVSQ